MRPADRFLVRTAHEAERFAIFQADMGRVREHAMLRGNRFQFVKLCQEFLRAQFASRKTAFGLVVRVDEILHGRSSFRCSVIQESSTTRSSWPMLPLPSLPRSCD